MSYMACPTCGGFVHSANLFFCEKCWLDRMKAFAQIIYLLKHKAKEGNNTDGGANTN